MYHGRRESGVVRRIFAILILSVIVGSVFTLSAWGDDPNAVINPVPPQQVPPIVDDSLSTPINSVVAPETPTVVDLIVLIVETAL